MIRLYTKIGLGVGPVSQNGWAKRWEVKGGGGEADGGETDLSLILSSVFIR